MIRYLIFFLNKNMTEDLQNIKYSFVFLYVNETLKRVCFTSKRFI